MSASVEMNMHIVGSRHVRQKKKYEPYTSFARRCAGGGCERAGVVNLWVGAYLEFDGVRAAVEHEEPRVADEADACCDRADGDYAPREAVHDERRVGRESEDCSVDAG